jgi:hypothetical protein
MQTGVALFTQKYTDWGRPDQGYWAADPKIAGHAIPSSIRRCARSSIPAIQALSTSAPAWPLPTAVSS